MEGGAIMSVHKPLQEERTSQLPLAVSRARSAVRRQIARQWGSIWVHRAGYLRLASEPPHIHTSVHALRPDSDTDNMRQMERLTV